MASIADIDPYLSRTEAPGGSVARLEPCVWQTPGPGTKSLSRAQIKSYARDGFLIVEGLLDAAEVAALRGEVERIAEAADPAAEDVIAEPDSDIIRSVFLIHEKSPQVLELFRDPRLAGAARQILGSDVYLHQSRVNFKPGYAGKAFPWHSDFETWHMEDGMPRMRALSVSILLTDNSEFNGPLFLVPGSHQLYVRCVGKTPARNYETSLRKQVYGVPSRDALAMLIDSGGLVSAKGKAGTVVFFDCNTMHGSAGNISPYPRTNVFFVFNSVENRLVEPFSGQPPRPRYLAERDVVPIDALEAGR